MAAVGLAIRRGEKEGKCNIYTCQRYINLLAIDDENFGVRLVDKVLDQELKALTSEGDRTLC